MQEVIRNDTNLTEGKFSNKKMGGAIRREDKDVLNPEAASFKVAEKCETLSSLKEEQKQIFS